MLSGLSAALLAVCAVLLAALWLALRRSRSETRRLRGVLESAGYEVAHGANAARAHLIALEQEASSPSSSSHLREIRRALERLEQAAGTLAGALRPESAGAPGSSSAPAPPNPA